MTNAPTLPTFDAPIPQNDDTRVWSVDGQTVTHCDCLDGLRSLAAESVDLIVTSPPYIGAPSFWGIEWHATFQDKRVAWFNQVWDECVRVLKPGCKLIINIANTKRRPYLSNVYDIYRWNDLDGKLDSARAERLQELLMLRDAIASEQDETGKVDDKAFKRIEKLWNEIAPYLYKSEPLGEIIWNKGYGQGGTAWGSFRSPSDISLADQHEYIIILRKFGIRARPDEFEKINTFDFKSWRNSVWNVAPEKASQVGHIAPFPLEIPSRLITLYSFENEIVLDPFLGSGTTLRAAKILNRKGIGFEHSEKYFELAKRNLSQYRMDGF